MAEYDERRRGPSFFSILIAVLLAGILLAMIAGLLMLRTTAQTVKGEVDRVREWGDPTIRPNPATIIREIQTLSRLETVSYSVEKVITVEKNQHGLADLLGLDEKLLFVAHGKVIAGIDLSKLHVQDITVTDDNIVIVGLPEAEVFICTLDNEMSYVYDHERGVLNRVFEEQSDLETLARQAAEDAIEEAALKDGILDIANTNAESYMRAFLTAMGFDQVIFALPGSPDAPSVTPTPG
jgi:hypothetical protein